MAISLMAQARFREYPDTQYTHKLRKAVRALLRAFRHHLLTGSWTEFLQIDPLLSYPRPYVSCIWL